MTEHFQCLLDGSHDFSIKAKRGSVCSQCGLMSFPSSHLSYKSCRYSYKVHFSINDYEAVLHEDNHIQRMTNKAYLDRREDLIKFVLDKGRLLKMSLKTLHLAVYIMDSFCEKSKHCMSAYDPKVVAACSLLIAAKSSELDERIPFISKLKKFAGLTNDAAEFKRLEVAIAEKLDWELHLITFYAFVEYYLTAGVLTPQDRVSKKLVDFMLSRGVEEAVRLLAKDEQTRVQQTLDTGYFRGASSSIRDANEHSPRDEYISLGSMTYATRNEVIKVFELYIRDLSNLLLREFNFWNFNKNCLATALILYTRGALMESGTCWNSRIKDLTGINTVEVRDPFSKVAEFITNGGMQVKKYAPQKPVSTSLYPSPAKSNQNYSPLPLGELTSNYDSKSQAGKYSSYSMASARENYNEIIPKPEAFKQEGVSNRSYRRFATKEN